MKPSGLLFYFAILLTVSGCRTTAREFEELCSRTAKIEISDRAIWKEYVRTAQSHYKRYGLDPREIKIEPINGYDVSSSLSQSKPGSVPYNTPVKTTFTMSRQGSTFAIVHSYYISFSGFSGPSPYECARAYPEFYEELRTEALAL